MNIEEYEQTQRAFYEAFARTVRYILEQALEADGTLPRPQSVRSRAKESESLRRRLEQAGNLNSHTIELDRRDLAGARLIFYTNNDVEKFLRSPTVRDNFEIEEDSTKVHHPTEENKGEKYRAVHYTVRLRPERTALPEYKRFTGLRCEIQVQTILNHAWSETSHDIIYKDKLSDGYGKRAIEALKRRFDRIMDKYLLPAGFEIQKAQQEYERLLQGKELFDKDVAALLDNAQNNNERYEILTGLKDDAIPHYDNHEAAYEGLKDPLLRTVRAARVAEPVPIETAFGNLEGFKADAVTKLVVEIISALRYADPVGSFKLLADIYKDEPNEDVRRQILSTVKNLAEYRIDVYKQVGPGLQLALIEYLDGLTSAEVDAIRPLALTVWGEALESHMTGTKWRADSVTLSTGATPASDYLREVRNKAMAALFAAFDRSIDDGQKRAVLSALDNATRTPNQGQYSNELLATTLEDATKIVDFITSHVDSTSFEVLQHIEHQFLYDYYRTVPLTEEGCRFNCQMQAAALVEAILNFRDVANRNPQFARYKVLVGFESVYPRHWDEEDYDFTEADEYRRAEGDRYLAAINADNEDEWFAFIERCAQTESSDLATFRVFGQFISSLARLHPEIAERYLGKASDRLRAFLAGFLNGLSLSGRADIYRRVLESELTSARNLAGITRHLRYSEIRNPAFADRLLVKAIAAADAVAVIESLLFALEHYGSDRIADSDRFIGNALTFLNNQKDARWVSEAWFLQKSTRFYDEITPARFAQLLENLGHVKKINYQVERILSKLAERDAAAVWDYFGDRLRRETAEGDEERYEAVPFRLHGLEKVLSLNPQLAIEMGLAWYGADDIRLFEFRGGRLLSAAFPDCTPEFARALTELVKAGGEPEAQFALAILQNYRGEVATHSVLKEIVARFSKDNRKMSSVRAAIDNTGVVSGELGFANAWREKKAALTKWLEDERTEVRAFAERHIAELDLMIAAEQRRAESDREMRNRDFDDDDEEPEPEGPGDGE